MAEKQINKSKNALAKENPFPHKNLISVKDFKKRELSFLFEKSSEYFIEYLDKKISNPKLLDNLISINLFLEPSTRTRVSFEIAAKRLGMGVINFAPSDSSIGKGETVKSTVDTLFAMNPDLIIIRSHDSGLVNYAARTLDCPIINAGDGLNEHPTQALLDALTIFYEKIGGVNKTFNLNKGIKTFKNLTITICGDISHSRVAHSNLLLLDTLGANLRICGPEELIPDYVKTLNVQIFNDFERALEGSDVVMMLRYQKERMNREFNE
ncbi:MAG: aspartate carbamoyltransferase catalytic subunit, partial [Sphingomonadales bacterium]